MERIHCSVGRRCWESDLPASTCGCSCRGEFHGLSLIGKQKAKGTKKQQEADPMPTLTRIKDARAKSRPVVVLTKSS
jgi:hypothetical protein